MSSTEADRVRSLAGTLFDEVVVPLAKSRSESGTQPYFPLKGDSATESYFVAPVARVMGPADFEFPGGGSAEGLIDALVEYWSAQGETGLVTLAPRLREIAEALREEASESDGKVSILCYTMF